MSIAGPVSRICSRRLIMISTPNVSPCHHSFSVVSKSFSSQEDTKSPTAKHLKVGERDTWFQRKYREYFDRGVASEQEIKACGVLFSSYCCQGVQVNDFFDYFDMPDTFFSWFLITELHMWMLINRIMVNNDEDFEKVRNFMIATLWQDCQIRVKLLDTIPMSERKETLEDLAMEFQAALLVYDRGIIDNDMELSNALWRRFFLCGTPDPQRIELLVKYVRQTMAMLDQISQEDLRKGRTIKWLNLDYVNAS